MMEDAQPPRRSNRAGVVPCRVNLLRLITNLRVSEVAYLVGLPKASRTRQAPATRLEPATAPRRRRDDPRTRGSHGKFARPVGRAVAVGFPPRPQLANAPFAPRLVVVMMRL